MGLRVAAAPYGVCNHPCASDTVCNRIFRADLYGSLSTTLRQMNVPLRATLWQGAEYAHNRYFLTEGHGTSGNSVLCDTNEVEKRD
jgi:hypothetical protein